MSDPTIFSDSNLSDEYPIDPFWGVPISPPDKKPDFLDYVEGLRSGKFKIYTEIEEPDEYLCNTCGEFLPKEEFSARSKHGQYKCNKCYKEYQKKYINSVHGKKVRKQAAEVRESRKANVPNTLSDDDWQFALEFFNHRCAVCERPVNDWLKLSKDHWIPISKGGGTTPDNIVPLCHGFDGCNSSKNNHEPDVWLIRMFPEAEEIKARIGRFFVAIAERSQSR